MTLPARRYCEARVGNLGLGFLQPDVQLLWLEGADHAG